MVGRAAGRAARGARLRRRTERAEAPLAGRDDREYRKYSSGKNASAGMPRRRMQPDLQHRLPGLARQESMGRAMKRVLAVRARCAALGAGAMVVLLFTSSASAQQTSGISGLVRDTSGAVLPGVTVEAASPALIEKVRTVVSDTEGRYNITDLRPGTYAVTFSLAGFNALKRDGVELRSGFTATVNADLQVGALEETITVTGAAPLVDTQNTKQQTVVSAELLSVLPSAMKSLDSILAITPSVSGAAGGVGGSAGTYRTTSVNGSVHGKINGGKITFDGMNVTNSNSGTGAAGYIINGAVVEEMAVESGGVTAESNVSGFTVNFIPKEGGNTFRYGMSGVYADSNMVADNLTDDLRARGLMTTTKVERIYDFVPSVGGPIRRDKLWFFYASRWTGTRNQWAGTFWNRTQDTPFYTPGDPAQREDEMWSHGVRLTWQASPRNKVSAFLDTQHNVVKGNVNSITTAPESVAGWDFTPQGLYQVSWNSPLTSKFLLEGGVSFAVSAWPQFPIGAATFDTISVLESANGFRYRAAAAYTIPQDSHKWVQRFAASYVTGSHTFKAGFQLEQGINSGGSTIDHKVGFDGRIIPGNVSYTLLNGVPNGITQYATPYEEQNRTRADLGIFAQDQWTIRRLTLNMGLRFDYFNGHVPAQSVPASPFVPERTFDAVSGVPRWFDLEPRLGGSYDLFGDGRTALKASFGRYVGKQGVVIARANNPMVTSVTSVNRTWTDANANFHPDCDLRNGVANGECGPFDNLNFGQVNITTRYADDVIHGFGKRDYLWDFAAEVQHQVRAGVSLNTGYYRNWAGNFNVTDNLEVTPGDFSPFCVTAPSDSRLPGGGGYPVCGLYDVSPGKFGRVNNLVRQASDFGKQSRVSDFISATIQTRLASGFQIGGGIDAGRTVTDNCFVVDSPQQLLNCRVERPFSAQTQLKMNVSHRLPAGFVISGIFKNESALRTASGGETLSIEANYAARNAEILPTLGRNLSACGGRTPCTATATVPLVAPYELFEDRLSQLDLRVTKLFELGRMRLQANVDMYNALNASPVTSVNTAYGSRWLLPAQILEGRMIQLSGNLTF
ncbi:MAG: hypothetical protein GEU82_06225 [Luteitalea sp.]|nr:hypothetical protein [Luteitalea sp.]